MPAGDNAFWSDVADILRPPAVKLVQQAAQPMTSGAATAMTFGAGSEEYDYPGLHDVATNTTRITVTKAGRWEFKGTVQIANTTAVVSMSAHIAKNGAAQQPAFPRVRHSGAGSTVAAFASTTLEMAVGDYAELIGVQSSGVSLNTQASGGVNSTFEGRYVGAI